MNFPVVFAQGTGAPPPSGGLGMTGFLVQIVAIIAIFYFIVIRPQQKERRNLENALLALKKGDELVTSGGIVAEVLHIQMQPPRDGKEQGPTMADRITIRSAESKLIVERGRIARVATKDK
jgi:preprotein translocase subunit YajC